jgi:hypothetical protein
MVNGMRPRSSRKAQAPARADSSLRAENQRKRIGALLRQCGNRCELVLVRIFIVLEPRHAVGKAGGEVAS